MEKENTIFFPYIAYKHDPPSQFQHYFGHIIFFSIVTEQDSGYLDFILSLSQNQLEEVTCIWGWKASSLSKTLLLSELDELMKRKTQHQSWWQRTQISDPETCSSSAFLFCLLTLITSKPGKEFLLYYSRTIKSA